MLIDHEYQVYETCITISNVFGHAPVLPLLAVMDLYYVFCLE